MSTFNTDFVSHMGPSPFTSDVFTATSLSAESLYSYIVSSPVAGLYTLEVLYAFSLPGVVVPSSNEVSPVRFQPHPGVLQRSSEGAFKSYLKGMGPTSGRVLLQTYLRMLIRGTSDALLFDKLMYHIPCSAVSVNDLANTILSLEYAGVLFPFSLLVIPQDVAAPTLGPSISPLYQQAFQALLTQKL